MMKWLIFVLLFTLGSFGCKKTSTSPGPSPVSPVSTKSYIHFLANTEWVGVDDGHRSQYGRPADFIFHADSSVTIYSMFNLSSDGGTTIISVDSINGKIKTIDSTADESTVIHVDFPDIGGEQIMTIKGRATLSMTPADPNNLNFNIRNYNVLRFPAAGISLKGTSWGGQPVNPDDPNSFSYTYPDLSIVSFGELDGNPQVTYTKNGKIVLQQKGEDIGILYVSYQQIGARVFLYGYNEDYSWDLEIARSTGNYTDYKQGRMMKYICLLMPAGDKMLIDSWSANARLPTHTQTQDTYGPAGVTPVITKR